MSEPSSPQPAGSPAADRAEGDDDNANEVDMDLEDVGREEVVALEDESLDEKDMAAILAIWEEKHTTSGFDPVPILKRLAEIFEKETETYMRKDPDPFDERHPYRTDPSCQFGFLLKQLFRKDHFMNKLVNDYLRDNYFTRQNVQKSSLELNIIACRLILTIMPGLETAAVFQAEYDNLIHRLYSWAEDSIEPLQSYATGLLAAAMEVSDIAVTFREQNARLVPKMLKRCHMLQAISKSKENDASAGAPTSTEPSSSAGPSALDNSTFEQLLPSWMTGSAPQSPLKVEETTQVGNGHVDLHSNVSNMSTLADLDCSRDASHQPKVRRMYIPAHPPSTDTSQMLILRYLTSLGEYQEFLAHIFEHRAMQLIFGYIESCDPKDTCLSFEALKYLASLLCHKKFALEFISHGGLELLLKVPRPSIASTGVSITLYYLAYCEDAMERICAMPKRVITDLVKYALWLLGRSYDSGKCHATMFFGLSFQFKVILDEFDAQDGLRKLYNVISILPILNPSPNDEDALRPLNEDTECAARQLVRHVCVALKKYMESHLFYKYTSFIRQQGSSGQSVQKAAKATLEQISEQIQSLQENTTVRVHWAPVDELLKLGAINLLLKIIAFSYEWNNSGRAETLRSALDVMSICCVVPRAFLAFCERLELPENLSSAGINSILGAAIGEIVADAEVQKSALAVLVHCVCAPIHRSVLNRFSVNRRKQLIKYTEEIIEKTWESVCSNNGIIVLLQLMQVKTPITDADCIRGMACRALAGLARSERVRQIIGKLPLFASGQIQHLMRDPILQEKRAEHVLFQKYALELLERVSGKTKLINNQLVEASLANMHKANVVAQTKIHYNEQQLYQLIYDHLESKGLTATAQMLQKEANLSVAPPVIKNFHQSPFDYKILPTNPIARARLRARTQELNSTIHSLADEPMNAVDDQLPAVDMNQTITPIKLIKKSTSGTSTGGHNSLMSASSQRSLQKQISSVDPSTANFSQRIQSDDTTNPAKISLDTIVTEYLTSQHALCNNPIATCPQFDLFKPHKCPEPKPHRNIEMDLNLTSRFFRAQSGANTMRLDRRFVHSNFSPFRTIRPNDYDELQFTACDIVESNQMILAGTYHGEAKAFNWNDGTELFSTQIIHSSINSIKSNRAGDLVLTSCSYRKPYSSAWSIKDKEFVSKLLFVDEFYVEFSNLHQDKILGTNSECCVIYDVSTGQKTTTLTPSISNQYTKNRATFCPTDELVLSDGVLFDVRSGKEIHKFDKLNQTLSGVFHPNGLEIISNTEVWDLRTFHLLQTVSVLNQCLIKFSPLNVMYSYNVEPSRDYDNLNAEIDTSFKVLDSYDYSSISTMDVKRSIYDFSVNHNGSYIALVENHTQFDAIQETFLKTYAVGARKNDEQDEEEEEDLESEEESGSDSSNMPSIPLFRIDDGRRRGRRRQLLQDLVEDFSDGWVDLESSDSDNDMDDDDDDNDSDDNDDNDDNDEDGGDTSGGSDMELASE